MPLRITLTDYGVGNLFSIKRSLEICGADVTVTSDMSELMDAECIVFPGVGAFDKTMERLQPYREDIRRMSLDGTPILGICIGMQIMFEGSAEGTARVGGPEERGYGHTTVPGGTDYAPRIDRVPTE